MAIPPVPVTYDFESVLYDITPSKPTNPSADPCVVIHLWYKFGLEVKFQSDEAADYDDDDGVVLLEEPEVQFLLSIPLDRLRNGDYIISHVLERTKMYLRLSECEYLKDLVSDFAASLLLEKGNTGHQEGIEMVVMLHSSKVVCTEKNLTESYAHETTVQEEEDDDDDDLMECVEDNSVM